MAGNISPPRAAFLTGLVLIMVTGGILAGIYLSVDPSVFKEAEEIGFYRFLRDYDFKIRMILEAGTPPARHDLNGLDYDLGRMERRASGVESWLSVLKRRRVLARLDSGFDQAYRQSIRKAAVAFPHSEQIAVIEAAALVGNRAVTGETESELRRLLPLLTDPRFAPALLSFHILLGDFMNPEKAAALLPSDLTPALFMRSVFSDIPVSETEAVITDLAIVKILTGDTREATAAVQTYLSADRGSADLQSEDRRSDAPSPEFTRFAAEYFYDFGDLLRSAQLFSGLPDEAALGRQADALWLAGHPDTTRNIWAMLAAAEGPLRERSLYNLAVTARTRDEAERLLKTLAGGDAAVFSENAAPFRLFGLIRYSRLLEAPQAVEVLEAGKTTAGGSVKDGISAGVLTDLEILGRRAEIREPARTIADTWFLLDTYPGMEELYEWGAWYFNFQRNHTESDILLRNAVRNNFSGQWLGVYEGLKRLRGGDTEGAEEILVSVNEENINWTAAANLGRIYEAQRASDRALENYQKAADKLMATGYPGGRGDGGNRRRRETASRIRVGIARTLKTQGRISESRQTLNYALELDPDNLTARLELSRLGE